MVMVRAGSLRLYLTILDHENSVKQMEAGRLQLLQVQSGNLFYLCVKFKLYCSL